MTKDASNLFIISGPSGAGEDSVINGLNKYLDFAFARTTSSRPMRPGEFDGDPYFFVSNKEFEHLLVAKELIEHDKHNGYHYGLTRASLNKALSTVKPVIWKTDYVGVLSAKKLYPDSIAIMISAPIDVIEERIRARGGLTEAEIAERISYAQGWFDHRDAFDYEVVNEQDKLDATIKKVAHIITTQP